MNDFPKYDAEQKIDLLLQLNDIYFWNRNKEEMVNLFVVQYFNQDAQAGNEWGGKIRHMTNAIERIGSQTQKNQAEMKAEMKKNQAEMKAEMEKNQAEIKAEIQKNQAEIMDVLSKIHEKPE